MFRRILSPVKTESTSTSSYCATVTMIAATTVTNLWTMPAVKVRWNSKLQFTLNMCGNISKWCPNLRLRLHVPSTSPFLWAAPFIFLMDTIRVNSLSRCYVTPVAFLDGLNRLEISWSSRKNTFFVLFFLWQNRSGVRMESRFWGTWFATESLTAATSRTKAEPSLDVQVGHGQIQDFQGDGVLFAKTLSH